MDFSGKRCQEHSREAKTGKSDNYFNILVKEICLLLFTIQRDKQRERECVPDKIVHLNISIILKRKTKKRRFH